MARYFNTHGPVYESQHYVVERSELLTELVAQIEQGKYFTIYAPRQMGKTTLLRRLADALQQLDYLPVTLDFEGFEGLSEKRFLQVFTTLFGRGIFSALPREDKRQEEVKQLLSNSASSDFFTLGEFWWAIHQLIPERRLVLIIDEFDATPQQVLTPLLQTWRRIYLASLPPRSLHSVILIGIQNIATLNMGRSSPFNIAYQLQLPGFTLNQVRSLLNQYTTETGQPFAEGVIEEIHRQTDGQPFLVNRLAAILSEEIATDRSLSISKDHLSTALSQLVREPNYNFETLKRHAGVYRDDVLSILFGAAYEFNLNVPLIQALQMHGIIKANSQGNCQIANAIYETVLLAAFRSHRWRLQADILVNSYDLRQDLEGNQLKMKSLLARFRQFVERRGREAFKVTPMPQEATGQYLLMAYLNLVVRQLGGDLFTEVDSGEGRLDLIVVHRGHRYVIETKIWRGQVEFDKGVAQLGDYLETEGETTGYLVVFHARPRAYGKLTVDQLEFTQQYKGMTIHVFLVRLGKILNQKSTQKGTEA